MSDYDDGLSQTGADRYQAADPRVREEVGGILERAFRGEAGRFANEDEAHCFLALADEAEARAEAAESLTRESEQAAVQAGERFALTGGQDDLAAMRRYEAEAEAYRREGEALRLEVERLRKYLP